MAFSEDGRCHFSIRDIYLKTCYYIYKVVLCVDPTKLSIYKKHSISRFVSCFLLVF